MRSIKRTPALVAVLAQLILALVWSPLSVLASRSPSDAASVTITIYSQSSDGEVLRINCEDWSSCRNAVSGTVAWNNLQFGTVESGYYNSKYHVKRLFLFFDTSTIPANASIDSAVLHIYAGQFPRGDSRVHLVRSTASTSLSTSDFAHLEFTSGGSTPTVANSWATINLNSNGLAWITKGGTTRLALANSNDVSNVAPTINNSIDIGLAESGTYHPYLTVTYSLGGQFTLYLPSVMAP